MIRSLIRWFAAPFRQTPPRSFVVDEDEAIKQFRRQRHEAEAETTRFLQERKQRAESVLQERKQQAESILSEAMLDRRPRR